MLHNMSNLLMNQLVLKSLQIFWLINLLLAGLHQRYLNRFHLFTKLSRLDAEMQSGRVGSNTKLLFNEIARFAVCKAKETRQHFGVQIVKCHCAALSKQTEFASKSTVLLSEGIFSVPPTKNFYKKNQKKLTGFGK